MNARQFVVISGCSSGGKSTLLAELGRRGYRTFEEPGRHVVKAEQARGGDGLPWLNAERFIDLVIAHATQQLVHAREEGGLAFFDRSLIDAANSFPQRGLPIPPSLLQALNEHPYHRQVFMAPPWPEIFGQDTERKHDLATATQEYEWLLKTYPRLGYEIVTLPKIPVQARADFVLDHLGSPAPR